VPIAVCAPLSLNERELLRVCMVSIGNDKNINESTHQHVDAMGGPVILVFSAVLHQLLVNDTRQKKKPPRVQILFLLQEALNMLRSIE
jgi:hypothetical protein